MYLFVFVLFFFFKQKTAYEIRISDWSSDVCSSDLRKFEHAHPTMAFEGVGYTAADQYALALYASAVGGGMSSRLFQELREEREIGRASCRERVCQYV